MEGAGHAPEEVPRRSRRRDGEGEHEGLRSLRDALRAASEGDFSLRLPVDAAGDTLLGEVAIAFNTLVAKNEALIAELDRTARAVGVEGETTRRATMGAASGSWARGVESVNSLVDRLAWPALETTRVL